MLADDNVLLVYVSQAHEPRMQSTWRTLVAVSSDSLSDFDVPYLDPYLVLLLTQFRLWISMR